MIEERSHARVAGVGKDKFVSTCFCVLGTLEKSLAMICLRSGPGFLDTLCHCIQFRNRIALILIVCKIKALL